MAAEVLGGAYLSVSLQELCGRMPFFIDFVRRNKVNDGLVKKLETMLWSVNGVLNDAETKQITNPNVKQWLDKLKDTIYDAEDLVFEIKPDAFQGQGQGQGQSRSSILYKVRNFFPSRITFKKLEERIREILEMLEYIVRQKDILGLREGVETRNFHRSCETVLVKGRDIYGRDDDKLAIFNLLLSDDVESGDKICVIPIVGMGGIGKTSLAQVIYMEIDSLIEKPFDIKAWITVSDEYDVFTLTKTIYERVTGLKNCHIKETFELQLELKKLLERKRVLLVLDDVWNLNSKNWGELKSPLESAASGSKIVVTTRNKSIAAKMGTVPNHSLQLLSEEDCWQLFSKQAFNNVEPSAYPKLNEIGIQIVKKCKGLPLAVKSLAGLLNTELNPKKWKNVLQNEIWDLPQEECKILPALWLSYYYLPPHLKQCFAYCSIFPKGYEFQKEILVFLWMAGDLLLPQNNKTPEEVGEEYFDDLTSRSLFQKISTCGFTMHDLLNDLATFVAGESCLRFNDNYSKVPLNKIRHLSLKAFKIHDMKKLKDLSENKVLRTLLHVDKGTEVNKGFLVHQRRLEKFQCLRVLSLHQAVADMKLLDSIGKLKLLRYLDLSWTEIKEIPYTICSLYNLQTLLLYKCSNLSRLPDSIANLKHLRHLDLSNTEVGEIPDAVCNLHSLHTLLLGSCRKLTRLPTNIEKLINLRRLDISDTSLRETPLQISSLRNLEMLSDFVVGTNSGSSIKMLGELQDLHGNLSIRSLEKVANVDDVLEANLKDKKCITDLSFEWGDNNDSQKAQEVLNRLQPQTGLARLSIINYGGINFSDWIGDRSFCRIEFMWLSKCKKCHNLPPLGQLPSLKYLTVDRFDMVEKIGDGFYTSSLSPVARPFKSLETLSFKCMPQWNEWSCPEGEVFAQLKELHLMDCASLTLNEVYFPDTLRSLTCLCIMKCQRQVVAALLSKKLPSLCSLRIRDYPELVSFPERRLPTKIHTIQLFGCTNLESFLDEGWPSNLKSLSIGGCGKLFVVRVQWNLHKLTSLTSLDFNCIDEVVNLFPEEGQIPLTLTSLKLSKLNKLRFLNGMAFRQLTSLKVLSIYYCDQLSCLPEGLPASLSQLDILSCRLLNERCQRDTGQDWSKIARISRIRINNEYI